MIEINATTVYTPYAIAKLINQGLAELNVDRIVPPQMMYNYDRNGLIVKGQKGQKRYSSTEVLAFLTKWFEKNYKANPFTAPAPIVDSFDGVEYDESLVNVPNLPEWAQ